MVATNYTNTFGGENVSPANLSYIEYTVSEHLHLTWAFEAVSGNNPTADKIGINCTVANASVMMPAANQVTVGQDVLFDNIGPQTFIVQDHIGNTICAVAPGTEWFIYVVNNTTIPGLWRAVQFGATISSANAGALAGAGLKASGTTLDQNLPTTALTASYTVTAADRATVLQNDGGGVSYTFPDASVVGDGWFVYVVNLGTGNIVLQPVGGDTIDESSNKTISPGESLIVLSDGANFQSVGYGRSLANTVTATSVNAAGTGTLLLTPTQVTAQIQDFTGTLTGNRRIEYGSGIGYWFVYNKTDPVSPFTMTFALDALDPGVLVPQGTAPNGVFSILRSNGTNMGVAFSGAVGTVTSVGGTADFTGVPITTTGILGLSNTGVVESTYGHLGPPVKMPSILVDIKGRIKSATELTLGSSSGIDAGDQPGNIPILDAGGNLPSKNGGMQPGDVQYSIALTKPGFVFANGTTIGSATSGASQLAAPETVNLFKVIWSLPAAQFPIYSQTGVLATRGATSDGDFNNNMRITVPDLRGTVIAGMDNAGGIATANRLSTYITSTVIGSTGGAQAEQANLNIPQLFVRTGQWSSPAQGFSGSAAADVTISGTTDGNNLDADSGGSGARKPSTPHTHTFSTTQRISLGIDTYGAHGLTDAAVNTAAAGYAGTTAAINVQPTMVMNPFIKL